MDRRFARDYGFYFLPLLVRGLGVGRCGFGGGRRLLWDGSTWKICRFSEGQEGSWFLAQYFLQPCGSHNLPGLQDDVRTQGVGESDDVWIVCGERFFFGKDLPSRGVYSFVLPLQEAPW